ncbi:MFS transporter, MHS family, alpha-ketoglutarate permease [Verrucomicrobium sp. GAS474]|uniref:MFS transporter n=1 Tax=Verrucomicrobium sp. GAS474 TaxID=1882831 RepID=UPI00087A33E8|nr:MFS transporter [Verrucomicrobium sp. GAS474]SDU23604.1 MFS transporter, MHS family, alpha-ketoglutarate permease [Verrucomicrobium sp. GAS474]
METSPVPLSPAADRLRRIKAIFIGSCGNLIEWFDFYTYTAFALYFAKSFFPAGDEVVQQLNAALLFAGGFLARPFGGWLFGHLADRYGRRRSLTLSVVLMCAGSLMIALCPTYATIGIAAPIVLGLARVIQGLSLGGEYGTSATYLSEVADRKHRGFYSSFQYVTLIGGQLTAIFVLLLLQQVLLSPEELRAWGWRIPFVIGGILAVMGAVMRRNLHETEQFLETDASVKKENPLRTLIRYPKEVALVIGLTAGGTLAFYTYTTYMQKFLKLSVHLTDLQTTTVVAASLIFALLLQPLYGALSDKIGRKPLLIAFGVLGTLCTVPLLTGLHAAKGPFECFLFIAGAWAFTSCYTSINAVVKAELFPAHIRATGVGVPYAVTVSIFGGTAEPIALKFKQIGHEEYFYYYASLCIFLSLLVYCTMRDTRKASLIE